TGKPKGVLHTSAGYLLGCKLSSYYTVDLKQNDRYLCTADIGRVTAHSYVVHGLRSNGATVFLAEGAANQPGPDRPRQRLVRRVGHRSQLRRVRPAVERSDSLPV